MKNWYNLPTYYDVSFSHEMSEELAFLKNVFRQYCKKSQPKLLEPACGTGRLMVPLLRSGFECSGFDVNQHALEYLKKKLERNSLKANIFNEDMASFHVNTKQYDGAYCTVDTFRHLLHEKQAKQHLIRVSKSLKKNGIYVLGLHLIAKQGVTDKVTRWVSKRGRLTVKTSMTMLALDKKKRTEKLKVVLKANEAKSKSQHSGKQIQYESIYKLRTYTLKQFKRLLSDTNVFEIADTYDYDYAFSSPLELDETSDYGIFILRKRIKNCLNRCRGTDPNRGISRCQELFGKVNQA